MSQNKEIKMRHKAKHRETEMEKERGNERKEDKEKGGEPKQRAKYKKKMARRKNSGYLKYFRFFFCEFLCFRSTFCMFVSLCVCVYVHVGSSVIDLLPYL